MTNIMKDVNREVGEWLGQILTGFETDPEIVENRPIEELRTELQEMGVDTERFHTRLRILLDESEPIYPKSDLQKSLSSEFWIPEGVGELLSAADDSITQEHEFTTEFGTIKLTCCWGKAVDDEPSFLWLSWEAESEPVEEFAIRLLDQKTQKVLYEVQSKKRQKDERTLTPEKLGFDPSIKKWGIEIVPLERTE